MILEALLIVVILVITWWALGEIFETFWRDDE